MQVVHEARRRARRRSLTFGGSLQEQVLCGPLSPSLRCYKSPQVSARYESEYESAHTVAYGHLYPCWSGSTFSFLSGGWTENLPNLRLQSAGFTYREAEPLNWVRFTQTS